MFTKTKSNQDGGLILNNIITVDEEDIEFIYYQLRFRREYFMDEMERQSKVGKADEVLICVNGINRLNKVITSILVKQEEGLE